MSDLDAIYDEPDEKFYMPVWCWLVIWSAMALSMWLAFSMFIETN